jgi:hypothetical protein
MSITDESENLPDHLTERINSNGWRVISNPSCRTNPQAESLKTLIKSTQEELRRTSDKRKLGETDPPDAA